MQPPRPGVRPEPARISVVIPAFNRADTIAAAIATALEQSLPPVEVIVVDDCSSDDTARIVEQHGDPRVVLVRQATNQGGGAARNAGIQAARGDWIALLDSDDLWREDKLATQMVAARGENNVIVYSNVEFFGGDVGRPYWNARGARPGESMASYMIEGGHAVQTSTLLLPTATARAVLFDERLKRHQDWDFVLRAERQGVTFRYVDAPLTLYRLSDQASISRNPDIRPTTHWLDVAGDLLDTRTRDLVALNVIVPKIARVQPRLAVSLIAGAIRRGLRDPRPLARAALNFVPPPLAQSARALARKVRAKAARPAA